MRYMLFLLFIVGSFSASAKTKIQPYLGYSSTFLVTPTVLFKKPANIYVFRHGVTGGLRIGSSSGLDISIGKSVGINFIVGEQVDTSTELDDFFASERQSQESSERRSQDLQEITEAEELISHQEITIGYFNTYKLSPSANIYVSFLVGTQLVYFEGKSLAEHFSGEYDGSDQEKKEIKRVTNWISLLGLSSFGVKLGMDYSSLSSLLSLPTPTSSFLKNIRGEYQARIGLIGIYQTATISMAATF